MRHATAPGNFDPEGLKLDDCSTQRNLSAKGGTRRAASASHLKGLGLAPGGVLTSQWCRCRETATLAFGAARDRPAPNSFLRARESEATQVAEVLARIAAIKSGDKPLVLVTHQVMVTAITGVYPQSGEVVAATPARKDGKAGVTVIGSVSPNAAK